MKFLKTKWYLFKTTGKGTGILRDKPLNTKSDAMMYWGHNKYTYPGFDISKGSKLAAMTAGNRMQWEVI